MFWPGGEVLGGVDCNNVNPIYLYSGDPVLQYGWINIFAYDYRQLPSTGPFNLEVGKPVNIIVAHIVGRGIDALNSITVSRNYSEAIQAFYESNFINIPVSVEDDNRDLIADKFELYQNYPNPFNPTTRIKYVVSSLPDGKASMQFVSLKVYDVLGKKLPHSLMKKKL